MERLKKYAKIHIECTSKKKEDKQVYKEFKDRMKKYLLDDVMELYKIPILSEDYQYAHELVKKYPSDRVDDTDECPGLYVRENRIIETDYTKKDYAQAKAYLVNLWYLAYIYI